MLGSGGAEKCNAATLGVYASTRVLTNGGLKLGILRCRIWCDTDGFGGSRPNQATMQAATERCLAAHWRLPYFGLQSIVQP